MTENSDPYLYPGTNVLKNLRGLTDAKLLERFEARRTHRRLAELIDAPLPGGFDIAHLKAIHRYIFQDVYEWAGQFRTVNLSKGGHLFGLATFLEPALQQILAKLATENLLVNLDAGVFANRAAYYLGELNAGHYIDWRATTVEEMTEASRSSHLSGELSLFAGLIRACLRSA
jgi:cell filamentation protein